MAWYQRIYFIISIDNFVHYIKNINFKCLLYIIIITNFLFYTNIFLFNPVECYPISKDVSYLQKHYIGDRLIYAYKNIEFNIVNEIMYKMKYTNFNKINYNVFEFSDIYGKKFPRWHPLSHYHLSFTEFSNINTDILVNMQFSTKNFNNCHLLSNYNLLSRHNTPQYIANNFYFYEKKELLTKLPNFNTHDYLINNKKNIDKHINNVINLYKI